MRRSAHLQNEAVASKAQVDNLRRERDRLRQRSDLAATSLASLDLELNELLQAETQSLERLQKSRQHLNDFTATNQYRVRGLRPGAYYAAAVAADAIEGGEWQDPDVLDRLREGAIAFEIGAAEKKTLNLVLTPLVR